MQPCTSLAQGEHALPEETILSAHDSAPDDPLLQPTLPHPSPICEGHHLQVPPPPISRLFVSIKQYKLSADQMPSTPSLSRSSAVSQDFACSPYLGEPRTPSHIPLLELSQKSACSPVLDQPRTLLPDPPPAVSPAVTDPPNLDQPRTPLPDPPSAVSSAVTDPPNLDQPRTQSPALSSTLSGAVTCGPTMTRNALGRHSPVYYKDNTCKFPGQGVFQLDIHQPPRPTAVTQPAPTYTPNHTRLFPLSPWIVQTSNSVLEFDDGVAIRNSVFGRRIVRSCTLLQNSEIC